MRPLGRYVPTDLSIAFCVFTRFFCPWNMFKNLLPFCLNGPTNQFCSSGVFHSYYTSLTLSWCCQCCLRFQNAFIFILKFFDILLFTSRFLTRVSKLVSPVF
jgi:hypothetical protein